MPERHIICFLIYVFLLIELGQGFEREGPELDKTLQFLYKQSCASILATDSAPYQGKLINVKSEFFYALCF